MVRRRSGEEEEEVREEGGGGGGGRWGMGGAAFSGKDDELSFRQTELEAP